MRNSIHLHVLYLGLFIFSCSSLSAVPIDLATSGLLAYYTFDGDGMDASGNGNHVSPGGNPPTLTMDRFGNANSSYNFSGAPQNLIASNPVIPPAATSIGLWIRRTGAPTGTEYHLLGNSNDSSHNGVRLALSKITFVPIFTVTNGVGSALSLVGSTAIPLNTWTSVVFTWDGTTNTDGGKIYVGGALDAMGTASTTQPNPGTLNLFIGGTENNRGHVGDFDDIAIWNRALSLAEVQTFSTGTPVPEPNVLWLLMAFGLVFIKRKSSPTNNRNIT